MLRITCDHCGRSLAEGESHFVVRIEVFAAPDAALTAADLDDDHMDAVSTLLEQIENGEVAREEAAPVAQSLRYDLCSPCRKHYLRDPLGKEPVQKLHFSEN